MFFHIRKIITFFIVNNQNQQISKTQPKLKNSMIVGITTLHLIPLHTVQSGKTIVAWHRYRQLLAAPTHQKLIK